MSAQSSASSSSSPSTSSPSKNETGASPSTGTSAATADRPGYSVDSTAAGTELKRADRRFITKAAESSMKEVALSQLAQERATNPQVKSFAQQMVSDHGQLNNDLMQLAARKGVSLEPGSSHGWLSGRRDSAKRSSEATGATATTGGATTGSGMSGTDMASNSNGTATGATDVNGTNSSGLSAGSRDSDLTSDRHYRSLAKKTGAEFDKEYVEMMVDDHESDVKLFEKAAKDAKDPEVRSFASAHLPTLQAHLQHIQGLDKAVAE